MLDALLNGLEDEEAAQVFSLERQLLPSGNPDHELVVGVDRGLRVGVIAFMDEDENWVPVGLTEPRDRVVYCIAGHVREFPEDCEVPLDVVREAVKEFLLTGGKRPTGIEWKAQYPDE
ncbi:Imm1 family immunity protein [Dactylosporangium sp. McL0621]|uniref:Imm1 family immunity protein n=1 Tax=Dactylosporangium sp. McL0621 TaxID=3415678 RepID=UPI003CF2E9AD